MRVCIRPESDCARPLPGVERILEIVSKPFAFSIGKSLLTVLALVFIWFCISQSQLDTLIDWFGH
jgi:hypothetical protein